MFVKYIQQETGTRVQIKGIGSGFVDQETGKESDEAMHIHITGPDEGQVARAKVLTEDLLEVVRSEHAKMAVVVQQQQMELHQAQMQYAAYAGYAPPQPHAAAPPPPPPDGSAPPPPPPDGSAPPPPGGAGGTPSGAEADAYAAYWYVTVHSRCLSITIILIFLLLRAQYGYDVNTPEFKAWAAQQQQQQAQYYTQGYGVQSAAPAPPADQPPPPPPPA